MFCPHCKAEYEPHVMKCKDCQVALVVSLPPEPPEPEPAYQELVTVYSVPSPALLDMAQSILKSAEIRYFIKGELIQNIIALGTYGGSFNLSVGPPEIQVAPEDAEEARILLNELSENEPEDSGDEGKENGGSEEGLTEEEEETADEMADEMAEEEREDGEYEDEEESDEEEEADEEGEASSEMKEAQGGEKEPEAVEKVTGAESAESSGESVTPEEAAHDEKEKKEG